MGNNLILYAIIALLAWNLIVFILYAIDKRKAQKDRWRISEATLLVCTFLAGGLGGVVGMYGLRHKTRHWKFRILVPLALVLQVAAAVWIAWYLTK